MVAISIVGERDAFLKVVYLGYGQKSYVGMPRMSP